MTQGRQGNAVRRRRSLRLRGYDYSQPGMYFVTVCTFGRALLFGNVVEGKVWLNDAGRATGEVWAELPRYYSGLEIDAFVVMPNHIHGIIVLHGTANRPPPARGSPASPRPLKGAGTAPLRATLGRAVARFKYESAKRLNAMRGTPGAHVWQRNYYEHIIRHGESLRLVRRYVLENPTRWQMDSENPDAICPEAGDLWARL
jgi:REP-associated tyrosine transposase